MLSWNMRELWVHYPNDTLLSVEYAPSDPLALWNRSAAYVLMGDYRIFPLYFLPH